MSRETAVRIAQAILNGRQGVVDGSRELARVLHHVASADDADFTVFVVVDSETDHIPIGELRRQWAPEALERFDRELAEAEALYREQVCTSCRQIIARFSHGSELST